LQLADFCPLNKTASWETCRHDEQAAMTFPDVLFYILATLTAMSAVAVVLTQNIVRAATFLLFALAGTAGILFLLGADFVGATQLLIYVGGTLVLVVFGVMLTAQGPFINMKIGAGEWAISVGVGLLLYGVLAVALSGVKPPPSSLLAGRDGDALDALGIVLASGEELEVARVTERSPADSARLRPGDLILSSGNRAELVAFLESKLNEPVGTPIPLTVKREGVEQPVRVTLHEPRALPASKFLGAALLGDRRATPDARLTGSPDVAKRERAKVSYLLPFEIVSVHLLVVLIGAAYLARAKRRREAQAV
jgi:NADH-quinone oxidoreductase subunit J